MSPNSLYNMSLIPHLLFPDARQPIESTTTIDRHPNIHSVTQHYTRLYMPHTGSRLTSASSKPVHPPHFSTRLPMESFVSLVHVANRVRPEQSAPMLPCPMELCVPRGCHQTPRWYPAVPTFFFFKAFFHPAHTTNFKLPLHPFLTLQVLAYLFPNIFPSWIFSRRK